MQQCKQYQHCQFSWVGESQREITAFPRSIRMDLGFRLSDINTDLGSISESDASLISPDIKLLSARHKNQFYQAFYFHHEPKQGKVVSLHARRCRIFILHARVSAHSNLNIDVLHTLRQRLQLVPRLFSSAKK